MARLKLRTSQTRITRDSCTSLRFPIRLSTSKQNEQERFVIPAHFKNHSQSHDSCELLVRDGKWRSPACHRASSATAPQRHVHVQLTRRRRGWDGM
eukprot:7067165-Prymnesium_polylepis.1